MLAVTLTLHRITDSTPVLSTSIPSAKHNHHTYTEVIWHTEPVAMKTHVNEN